MNCTCGSQSVGSDKHSIWCDCSRHISIVAKKDMENANVRYLYVVNNAPSIIFEELKKYFKDVYLMCMDFNGVCSIVLKNNSEIYFINKDELNKEHITNFDGAYADKCLENINISKHLKPLAEIKYVKDNLVV